MCGDPGFRRAAAEWLEAHPSGRPEVDVLWAEALNGRGLLGSWLDGGADPSAWSHPTVALHSVLSSHPFPHLSTWSLRPTSAAS